MASTWACLACGDIIPGDEQPEKCTGCGAGKEYIGLWTTTEDFVHYPQEDWCRKTWWQTGTGFRAGKIRTG